MRSYSAQALYDYALNTLNSLAPRSPKRNSPRSWQDYIPSHLRDHLAHLQRSVDELELVYSSDRSRFNDLSAAKCLLNRQISFAMKTAADEILNRNRNAAQDHSCAWKVFQSLKDSSQSVPISMNDLLKHFRSVFQRGSPLVPSFERPSVCPLSESDARFELAFSDADVRSALESVNLNAAPGPDGVTPRLARRLLSDFKSFQFFVLFFNLCFDTAMVPVQWSRSHVFVLYKGKGARGDPNSYRGINLLSVFMKIYEKLLLSRLTDWASSHNLLGREQFAFRSGSSTIDAAFLLQTLTQAHFSLKSGLCAVFVDLKKAFPSLSRSMLLSRLALLGLPPKILNAIASLFVSTSSRLRVDNFLSEVFSVTEGVLEGGILSPILFILAFASVWDIDSLADFPSAGRHFYFSRLNLWILVYADDLVVVSPSFETISTFLSKLDEVLKFFRMEISVEKTVGMRLALPRFRAQPQMPPTLLGRDLALVESFPYLGVRFTSTLSWDTHLGAVLARARTAASKCVAILEQLSISSLPRSKMYFLSFVESQFYAIELYPDSAIAKMSSARHFFVCKFFDLPSSTPSAVTSVFLPLKRPSLTILGRKFSFFERVCSSALPSVLDAIEFHLSVLLPRATGFFFDAFKILKVADRSFRGSLSEFDFLPEFERVMSNEPDDDFVVIAGNLALDNSPCSDFFRLLDSPVLLRAFYDFVSTLPRPLQKIFIQFVSSNSRWRFTRVPSVSCPLCGQPWVLRHFFLCASVLPFLSLDCTWLRFRSLAKNGDWPPLLSIFKEVILSWSEILTTCVIPTSLLRSILNQQD